MGSLAYTVAWQLFLARSLVEFTSFASLISGITVLWFLLSSVCKLLFHVFSGFYLRMEGKFDPFTSLWPEAADVPKSHI